MEYKEDIEIIRLENISKVYESVKALENISYTIRKGEIFCLLGPNGSGKTTTIKLLMGQIEPTNGKIFIKSLDPIKDRNKLIYFFGLVPQEISLYEELTARENLEFHGNLFRIPKIEIDKKIDEMLKLAGLINRQHDLVKTYSGGMKRRLQLIRALLHEPEIVLLDEPTLGVDVQSRNAINEYIIKIAEKGKTIILTTNYLEEAEKLADRLVILDNKLVIGPENPNKIQENEFPETIIEFTTDTIQKSNFTDRFLQLINGELISIKNTDSKSIIRMKTMENVQKSLEKLLEFCKNNNIKLDGLNVKTPTLEDIFLKLTGKAFRDKA